MALNSKREQIIEFVVAKLEAVSSIETVVRKKQSYHMLQEFAVTQLPVAAVVGRLPRESKATRTHVSSRSCVDVIISELPIDVFIYAQDNEEPDSLVSNLADDVWAALYADQYMDGLVVTTRLQLTEEHAHWRPFIAFILTVFATYQHTTGGI